MKNEYYSASSCAVENYQGGLRLSLTFWHIGEYFDAHRNIQQNEDLFRIDNREPKHGGSCAGSKLVVLLDRDFAKAAAEELGAYHIRREIEYVNGSRTTCESIAQAIGMALDHS